MLRPSETRQLRQSDILVLLPFDPAQYDPQVAKILALEGGGARPMELFPYQSAAGEALANAVREELLHADPQALFPGARDPQAALSGLFLYFSCLTEAHELLHRFTSPDGFYWHAVMHRMEGDAYNAAYWFHRISGHPVWPAVAREASLPGYKSAGPWDPFAFIRFCEASAKIPDLPGNDHDFAKRVQLAEWQVLFDYCAAPVAAGSHAGARMASF